MEAVTTVDSGRPYTADDLDAMPDDGRRYELIDGTLIVSPSPMLPRQRAQARLLVALTLDCPVDLEVLGAPLDVRLADDTVVQPDILVARKADLTGTKVTTPPVLAVEILSPSTRLVDLNLKRARYERAGIPSYWVVDTDGVRLVAFELDRGEYREVANVTGDEAWSATSPYTVTVAPSRLV